MAESDRVAELKRKMQERAKQVKAETADAGAAAVEAAGLASAPVAPAAVAEAPAAVSPAPAAVSPAPAAVAEAPAAVLVVDTPVSAEAVPAPAPAAAPTPAAPAPAKAVPVAAPAPFSTNGGAPALADTTYVADELSPEERARRELGRREFLTYAFAGALALVAGATGFGIFEFMYPRFRAGEFGGEFFIAAGEVPAADAPPVGKSDGKFWLVQSEEEGPKALYMVCTHLGCLYKWEPSTFRFECPCHGSMFTKDGFYIRGPAARSLDQFETRIEGETLIVNTGAKITGGPATESPAREV